MFHSSLSTPTFYPVYASTIPISIYLQSITGSIDMERFTPLVQQYLSLTEIEKRKVFSVRPGSSGEIILNILAIYTNIALSGGYWVKSNISTGTISLEPSNCM